MNLRTLDVGRLKPAPYNPRKSLKPDSPGYRRLVRSIAEFDLVQPIVWNERTGHVVAGHQRLQVLKDNGTTRVECVVVDLTLAKEQALNVALNNAAVGSDWDDLKLHALLGELADLPEFDATLTGFDADELSELLLEPVEPAVPTPGETPSDEVRVTLLVPADTWEAVRPAIDDLVAGHRLEVHVRLPK